MKRYWIEQFHYLAFGETGMVQSIQWADYANDVLCSRHGLKFILHKEHLLLELELVYAQMDIHLIHSADH